MLERRIHFSCAILACFSYAALTALAYLQYPPPYSPSANWLSDLGNETVNVRGAAFYNIGIVTSAVLLLAWFLSLSAWRPSDPSPRRWLMLVAQLAGAAGTISLVMSAFYPINMFEQHSFWSRAHFMMLSMGFGFSVASLRFHSKFPRPLLYLGTGAALLPVFVLVFKRVYFLEWIAVAFFLAYVLAVGLSARTALRQGAC